MKLRVDEESLCVRMSLEEATLLMEQGHLSQRLPALGEHARCRVELTVSETPVSDQVDLELMTHALNTHALTLRVSRERMSDLLRSSSTPSARTKDSYAIRGESTAHDFPVELRVEVDLFSVRDALKSRDSKLQSKSPTLG